MITLYIFAFALFIYGLMGLTGPKTAMPQLVTFFNGGGGGTVALITSDSRSLLAYSIPAILFAMGCFYVFGCLQQLHGATPSVRTFIGVLPMLGSINITLQLLRVARLKGLLQEAVTTVRKSPDVLARG